MTYSISIYSKGDNGSVNYTPLWKNFRHTLIVKDSLPFDIINIELRKYNCTKMAFLLSFETEEDFLIFKLKFS